MLLDVKYPQVLILAPTREIAHQICSVINSVGSEFDDLNCCTFIGGTLVADNKENAHNCQIAVGSPGRIKQLINEGVLKTNSIRLFVLDEADQLLTNTFIHDIDDIFLTLPKDKQVIATSATYSNKLQKLTRRYFRNPYLARLDIDKLSLLGMIHYTYLVNCSDMAVLIYKQKLLCLEKVLTSITFSQCLVFCSMVSKVKSLSADIKKWGFSTTSISSAKEQAARLQAIDKLKRFKCKVLVSSDLTSRGIDAENVDLVINFDVPNSTEVYLHRAGRAGRYGSKGVTITFFKRKEAGNVKNIEREGNFKSYPLPDPIPANLISLHPEDLDQVEYTFSDSSEKSNDENTSIESGQDNMNKNSDKRALENGKLPISFNRKIEGNIAGTKLLKATQSENQIEIPLSDPFDLSDSSTESATSQSCINEYEESQNRIKNPSFETPEAVKEDSFVNGCKHKGRKGKKKLEPKVKQVDMFKTIENISENSKNLECETKFESQILNESKEGLSPTALSNHNTNASVSEDLLEIGSTISNLVLHEKDENSVSKAENLKCDIYSLEIQSNGVQSSSKQGIIYTKDIVQLDASLSEYYLTVLNSFAAEHTENNSEVSVSEEDGNTISKVPSEKESASHNSLPENQEQNVNEFGTEKETNCSSCIESEIPFKGEVIYTAKSTDDSSDSSSSSCDSWKATNSLYILERRFKEMVKSSYKKKPSKNPSMPTLSASNIKNITQLTADKSQAKGAIFIDSSSTPVESNTSDEESSGSYTQIDTSDGSRKYIEDSTKGTDRMSSDSSEDSNQSQSLVQKTSKYLPRNRISAKFNKNIPFPEKSVPKRATSFMVSGISGEASFDVNKYGIQKPKHQGGSSRLNGSTAASKDTCRPKQWSRHSKNKFSHKLASNFSENATCNNQVYNSSFHNTSDVCRHQEACCMGHGNVPHTNCIRENSHFSEQYINQLPHCSHHTAQYHFAHDNTNYQSQASRQWYDMFYRQMQCIQNACFQYS